jgi:hypothetical protein
MPSHSSLSQHDSTVVGERLSMPSGSSDYATSENDMSAINPAISSITDLDDSLHNSCTLPSVDDEPLANDTSGRVLFFNCLLLLLSYLGWH